MFGAAAATEAFTPLLRKSSVEGGKRIVFVSSALGSVSIAAQKDSPYPGNLYTLYRSSEYHSIPIVEERRKRMRRADANAWSAGKSAVNMIMISYSVSLEKEGLYVFHFFPYPTLFCHSS